MATKNDITNDSLITKASSEAYRNNYDLIFKKKEPVSEEQIENIQDADEDERMTKTYTFYDDSWYDRPPCDCCLGGWVECYNSSDTNSRLGSAHSEEECYVQAIKTESDAYMEDDSLWELEISELKKIAEELGIIVEIIS